jgi:N utilization substance protein B
VQSVSGSRHAERQHAVALLYEADVRGDDPLVALARSEADEEPPAEFTVALVSGVAGARPELDRLIAAYARGWTLDRMPVVDRNVLRLGLWELICSDVPIAVAIDEAVELANELSTEDSGRFINGVLAHVARSEDRVAQVRAGSSSPQAGGATSL